MYVKGARLPLSGVLMLAGLVALAPLGTDIYLSAVPSMAASYGVSLDDIELSISFFLIGISLGQLMGGPLSDRFGRRKTVTAGVLVFAMASIGIVFFNQLSSLLGLRLIQALGVGLASVSAMAVVRDISTGRDGAGNMMRVVQIMMAAPLVAPMLGMIIYRYLGWPAIFVFLMLYSLVLLLFFLRLAPETSPMAVKGNPLVTYGQLLCDRRVWPGLASACGAYAILFSFITASPTVYMGYFGLDSDLFPFAFGANVIAMIALGQVNIRLLKRFPTTTLIVLGQCVQLAAGSLMVLYLLLSAAPSFWMVLVLVMAFMSCHALVVSNSISSTTEFFPDKAGSATALLSASGFMSGALIGSLTGVFADGTPMPMAAIMLSACAAGLVLRFLLRRGLEPVSD